MKAHRFWITNIPSGKTLSIIDPSLVHQISEVLKLRKQEKVCIFNESGEWEAEISQMLPKKIELLIHSSIIPLPPPKHRLHLAVSLLKGDTWDDLIRQCTELGVNDFQPLICQRSIVRTISPHKLTRWKRIAQEATEQSGWQHIPQILPALELQTWLKLKKKEKIYVANMSGKLLKNFNIPSEMHLAIGPEGGWSKHEIDLFAQLNVQTICFGPSTLTARVAPGAFSAAILAS